MMVVRRLAGFGNTAADPCAGPNPPDSCWEPPDRPSRSVAEQARLPLGLIAVGVVLGIVVGVGTGIGIARVAA